jgi:hypothetical protein
MKSDGWLQDLRIAVRSLAKQKAWTAVAIVTLALGSGANTALFTIVNAALLRPLPYPDSDRIVSVSEMDKGVDHGTVPVPTFSEWGRTARSFSALAAYTWTSAVLGSVDAPEVVDGARVSASYFRVLGLNPRRGRVFTAEEDRPGSPVVVLSDQLWRLKLRHRQRDRRKDDRPRRDIVGGDRRHAGVVHHRTPRAILDTAPAGDVRQQRGNSATIR